MKNKKKERPFINELLINIGLIYSLLVAVFLLPYIYLKKIFSNYLIVIAILLLVLYTLFWLLDKKAFFENELDNKRKSTNPV